MPTPAPLLTCPHCQHTAPASEFTPPREIGSQLVEAAGVVFGVVIGAVAVWLLAGGRLP